MEYDMEGRKEIGSFLELNFLSGLEYYNGKNVARLNAGRTAIYHAMRILDLETIYLPYYQCDTVRDFLIKKGVKVKYYHCDKDFNPLLKACEDDAILLVNYFGIMSTARMNSLASKYQNVIIDNSQAFFAAPIDHCMNVYSARKFIGVPDGAYLLGNNVNKFIEEYEQDYSSDTSLFLLQRIEYGCEGKSYETREINEDRINNSDVLKMSKLTYSILDGTDYHFIKQKRKANFEVACKLFDQINEINPPKYYDDSCVPMVYPLVIEDDLILSILIENKVFQGHWWNYLLNEVNPDSFEYFLSKNIIPITIDQRYGEQEIKYVFNLINKDMKHYESVIDNNVMA